MKGRWYKITIVLFALAIGLLACEESQPKVLTPCFYYWKTNLQLTGNELLFLDSLGVKKLYVKFFDVDWSDADGQPQPHAQVQIDTAGLKGVEVVPAVFITNRTFLKLQTEQIPALAERIFLKIKSLAQPHQSPGYLEIRSIQFDCDWTAQTRDKFFALLEYFKALPMALPPTRADSEQEGASSASGFLNSLTLSATIRLHQLKYFEKTGVPPVDRGMLMFYNMSDLEKWETSNSILDLEEAGKYLSPDFRYPLPLDLALPLFHWGVLFRDGYFFKLINNLEEESLQDTTRFAPIGTGRFIVKKSTYLKGFYLYEGDLIRLEAVTATQLEGGAALLSRLTLPLSLDIAFYHMDERLLKDFPAAVLEKALEELK